MHAKHVAHYRGIYTPFCANGLKERFWSLSLFAFFASSFNWALLPGRVSTINVNITPLSPLSAIYATYLGIATVSYFVELKAI